MGAAIGDEIDVPSRRAGLLARPRCRDTLRAYAWIGAALALYIASVWGSAWAIGVGYKVSLVNYLVLAVSIYAICLVVGLLARLFWIMLVHRPRRLFRHIANDFTGNLFSLERLTLGQRHVVAADRVALTELVDAHEVGERILELDRVGV